LLDYSFRWIFNRSFEMLSYELEELEKVDFYLFYIRLHSFLFSRPFRLIFNVASFFF